MMATQGSESLRSPSRTPAKVEGPDASGLPVHRTPLVGRDFNVCRTVRALEQDGTRLVTVTGPGGIGKTRVTVEAAHHQLRRRFPAGVFFVPLVGVATAAELAGGPDLHLPTGGSCRPGGGRLGGRC